MPDKNKKRDNANKDNPARDEPWSISTPGSYGVENQRKVIDKYGVHGPILLGLKLCALITVLGLFIKMICWMFGL